MRWTYLWKHLVRIGQIAALAATAFAQPPLTTIQDTLYKADGTRFNGLLMIETLKNKSDDKKLDSIREEIRTLCKKFPIPQSFI